jgi:hypothetical protein
VGRYRASSTAASSLVAFIEESAVTGSGAVSVRACSRRKWREEGVVRLTNCHVAGVGHVEGPKFVV